MPLIKVKQHQLPEPEARGITDKAAYTIARPILAGQRQVARILSKRFRSLSGPAKRGTLLLLGFLFADACLWVLGQATRPQQRKMPLAAVGQLLPALPQPGRERTDHNPALFYQGQQHLQQLTDRVNAYTRTAEGRRRYDSLLRARPGLQDSIRFLQQFYRPHSPLLK